MKKTGLKKNTIDKFYTIDTTVKLCINTVIKNIKITNKYIIIELSVGNGSFINNIKLLTKNTFFLI